MRLSSAQRHIQHIASLGLSHHAAIPEVLSTVERIVPAFISTFFQFDRSGAISGVHAPRIYLDALRPEMFDWGGVDPRVEPTLDMLVREGRRIDNSTPVYSRFDLSRSTVINEMARPIGIGMGLDMVVRDRSGRPLGILFINREERFSRFTPRERRALSHLHDQLAALLSGPDGATIGGTQMSGEADRSGMLLCAHDGRLVGGNRDGLELWAELVDEDRLGMALPHVAQSLPGWMAELAAALSHPPSPTRANRAGRRGLYRARADWLVSAASPRDGIVISIDRLPPRDIRLLRRVADLELSPSERRIAFLVGQGLDVDAMAARLGLTVGTLRGQLKSIYARTGIQGRAELQRAIDR